MVQLRGRNATIGISITSGMGFILFGYDLGVLGGVLNNPNFMSHFPMSSTMEGFTTGCFELAAAFGAISMIWLGNYLGRRNNVAIGTIIISIGAAIQASSFGLPQLIIGRFVGGIGLGVFTANAPIWQAETTRANVRGRSVGASLSFLVVGLIISYWLDYGMARYAGSIAWRFPFAFQAVLGLSCSALTRFVPDSPRWLMIKGRVDEAKATLAALRDAPENDEAVVAEIAEIARAIELEEAEQKGFMDLFQADDNVRSRRRLLTGACIQCLQPFSGSTVISFYVTSIFQHSIGLTPQLSSLMSGYLQIWFLVASLGAWYTIERVGRRTMFLWTAAVMALIMFSMAVCIKLNTKQSGIGAAFLVFLYESVYTLGWMSSVWMYTTEIQTLRYRTIGGAIGPTCQWVFNYVMLQVSPVGFANIGWKYYLCFGIFNACFVPIIYFIAPETAGIPLESIDLVYRPGVDPVVESRRIRAAIKAGRMDEVTLVHAGEEAKVMEKLEAEFKGERQHLESDSSKA